MMKLLLSILKCSLNQDNPGTVHIPESVSHITHKQQEIGWHQLLQGRFTDEWQPYYQQYLEPKATNRKNGYTWVTSVIPPLPHIVEGSLDPS